MASQEWIRDMADRFYRRVLTIRATDSPNVALGLEQRRLGLVPTDEMIVPGVLTYGEYVKRLAVWDPIRVSIGLLAQFWEGAELLLFPPVWLDRSEQIDALLAGRHRQAKGIGIDPGEGMSDTAMTAVDELGVLEQVGKKTPDTRVIVDDAVAFIREHGVPGDRVCIDRGGGGKQLRDRLRDYGLNCRTVAFGEPLQLDPKRGLRRLEEKVEAKEEHYEFFDRRSQMYGTLRMLLDPANEVMPLKIGGYEFRGFAIPAAMTELRRELAPIPLTYNGEGRLRLLPKSKPAKPGQLTLGGEGMEADRSTLTGLLGGRSPDRADSCVLAIHAMLRKAKRPTAGAIG